MNDVLLGHGTRKFNKFNISQALGRRLFNEFKQILYLECFYKFVLLSNSTASRKDRINWIKIKHFRFSIILSVAWNYIEQMAASKVD